MPTVKAAFATCDVCGQRTEGRYCICGFTRDEEEPPEESVAAIQAAPPPVAPVAAIAEAPQGKPAALPVILSYFGILVVTGFVGAIWLFDRMSVLYPGWPTSPSRTQIIKAVAAEPSYLLFASIVNTVLFVAAALIGASNRTHGKETRRILLTSPRIIPTVVAATLFLMSTRFLALLATLGRVTSKSTTLPILGEAIKNAGEESVTGALFFIAVLPALGEELFFRGYMQPRLVARWGKLKGVVVTSALFGLAHFDLVHTPLAFGMGLVLGWILLRTGSLGVTVLAHLINNALVVLDVREYRTPASSSHGLAALVLLVVVVLCSAAFYRVTRRTDAELSS